MHTHVHTQHTTQPFNYLGWLLNPYYNYGFSIHKRLGDMRWDEEGYRKTLVAFKLPSLIKCVGHCITELKDFGSCALLKPKWDQWWVACFWQTGLLGVIARCGLWEQNQASCAPKGGLRDGSFWASELPQRGISIQCHCLQLRSLQLQWNSLFHLWQKSQTWEALLTKTMPNEGSSFYSCSR